MYLGWKSAFPYRSICAMSAIALGVGCRGGESATYVLKTANRDTMPVIVHADSVCLVQLMGGTLILKNRKFSIDYTLRKVCPTGSTPLPDPGTHGRYDINIGVITFRDSLGSIMNRGELRGDTVAVPGRMQTLRFIK
ncbi:MAG: hypothetical protein ABIS27_08335 [Longimicrobiales bacterium]